jgi:hypothetical protein
MSSGRIFKTRNLEGIPVVPAVAHGDDSATSDREHGVGLVSSGPDGAERNLLVGLASTFTPHAEDNAHGE